MFNPLEYYQQVVKEFNKSAFDSKDYSPVSNLLLDAAEEQLRLYRAPQSFTISTG
jgi:hypothetical protein